MGTKIKILHNPRCTKSREALEYLTSNKIEIEIVEYLKNGIDKEELKSFIQSTGLPIDELLRKNEDDFKLHLRGKELSDEEIIDLMIQYPKIIQRPIVMNGQYGVIARPCNLIDQII